MSFFEKLFGSFSDKELKRINPLKDKVLALEPEMAKLTDDELRAKTKEFQDRCQNKGESLDSLLPGGICGLPRGGVESVGDEALPRADHRRNRAAPAESPR